MKDVAAPASGSDVTRGEGWREGWTVYIREGALSEKPQQASSVGSLGHSRSVISKGHEITCSLGLGRGCLPSALRKRSSGSNGASILQGRRRRGSRLVV